MDVTPDQVAELVDTLTRLRDRIRVHPSNRKLNEPGTFAILRDADRVLSAFGVPLEPKRDA